MKYKVHELDGPLLDRAVAKACGYPLDEDGDRLDWRTNGGAPQRWRPSRIWDHGGPIIDRERITIIGAWHCLTWRAGFNAETGSHERLDHAMSGPTALVAAMRSFVVSRLGEEVELP